MKKTSKILSLILSVIMIITRIPVLSTATSVENTSDYSVGDIVEFGSYPQSEVEDYELLSELNSLSVDWISYGYYVGTGDLNEEQTPSDYMKYADVTYEGNKYRAVTFSEYRPYVTAYPSSFDNSFQNANGYYINTVYWFKYEPIEWRVLDPDEGIVMCESIIDSQAYNDTVYDYYNEWYQDSSCENYANNYATSSIRDWLNNDFYKTAFTSEERAEIFNSVQDNISPFDSKYDNETTHDKIFLLSYYEALNDNYGFSTDSTKKDLARQAQGTDYAKCQGLYGDTESVYNENYWWWLRSADNYSGVCFVTGMGCYNPEFFAPCWTSFGIRPAMKMNLQQELNVKKIAERFSIMTPSRTEIRNKDGIVLHANIEGTAPAGSYIEWTSNNNNFDVGESADRTRFTVIAEDKGYTIFTATLYDADENVLATDSVELYSKSGFFHKIGGFFRSLFGSTKIYEY